MNTLLKTLALLLTAAVPSAFSAELAGISLPAVLDTSSMLTAFVAVLTLLMLTADYRRSAPVATRAVDGALRPRSVFRLAA